MIKKVHNLKVLEVNNKLKSKAKLLVNQQAKQVVVEKVLKKHQLPQF